MINSLKNIVMKEQTETQDLQSLESFLWVNTLFHAKMPPKPGQE